MRNLQTTILALFFIFLASYHLQAQDNTLSKKNIIKLNITSPAIATFALGYERVLDDLKTFQISAFYRNRPSNDINLIEAVQGWGITPEVRFYLSNQKIAPQGFFIAPYATYQQYQTEQETFNNSFFEIRQEVSSVFGLGFIFGGQWVFKEIITVDLWGGPGYYFTDTEIPRGEFVSGTTYQQGASYSGRFGVNIGIIF